MGRETFIDWRLGTQAQFDAVAPVGYRQDDLICRRPGTAPLADWSRATAPHGQRVRVDTGTSALARFQRLSNTAKLGIALKSAAITLGPEAHAKLHELMSPTNLAIMAGALAVWIGAQATPIGWVVDIGMVGLGVVALGTEAVAVIRELHAFAMGVIKANSEADLAQAGRHLAKAIAIVGVDVVMALLLKKALVKVREPKIKTDEGGVTTKVFGKYDAEDAAKSLPPEKKVQTSASAKTPPLEAKPANSANNGTLASNPVNAEKLANDLRTAELANPAIESLKTTGRLPDNYVNKSEAAAAGWRPGKALDNAIPGGQIGGDTFKDPSAIGLPTAPGRVWYEADIGLAGSMTRAKQPGTRLLYSNDGKAFVTPDHYRSIYQLPDWK